MIAALAAAAAIKPEPHDLRMLVANSGAIVAVTPQLDRSRFLPNAQDAAYSPDGTLVAFAREGDLWVANSDGSGQRRLAETPNVEEWGASWLPDGKSLVYTAKFQDRRQIRVYQLPTGPSKQLARTEAEEYGATVSSDGKLAFVSTRGGTPAVYVAQLNGFGAHAFDTTPPPAGPYADVHDLAWSPDGKKLAYAGDTADGISTKVVVDDATTQTEIADGRSPVWAPTGGRIAFTDPNGQLVSIAPDGTDSRALGPGRAVDWQDVSIAKPLFPNLVQRPPSGLVVSGGGSRWLLGFTSMVDNRGPGIVWVRGYRKPAAHVMQVRQYVQLKGGGTRVAPFSGELHYVVAPPHYHWHFLGFDHYELRGTGDFKLFVRDYKSGFCIADHWGHAIGVSHGPPRFLSNCEQFNPRATFVEEGSSVGYTDRYPAFFHGQALDISKVKAGKYWLVHRANEDFHLRETSYSDDAASLLVRITWPAGHRSAPRVTTLRTCLRERC